MRLLHIDTESGFRGGERQVWLLAKGLMARGHEQMALGRVGSEFLTKMSAAGIAVHAVPVDGMFGVRSPMAMRTVQELARRFRPDLVHAHTGNAHTLAQKAFLGSLPIVVTRRVDFPVKPLSRKKYRAPGQHYIAISSGIRDVLLDAGVPAERIDVVPSGVDVARVTGGNGAALRREWLGNAEGPLIGFVGALVDHKAPWILAEAAPLIRAELPGARFVFIGEGEERPRIEALAAQHPGTMTLAGWREDIADCYAALDLFVMPSRLEGLCTALIDALAAGVPCVATKTGGIPDVIGHGRCGDLVEPFDANALAAAIVALWKDEPRRRLYVEEGRRRAEQRFTADAMVEGNLNVYTRIQAGSSV